MEPYVLPNLPDKRNEYFADTEAVVELSDIQGDPMYGFNKPHGWYICADIQDANKFKEFLKQYTPAVTTASAVNTFRVQFRALRSANNGIKPSIMTMKNTITKDLNNFNIAFGYQGMAKLLGEEALTEFGDISPFRIGLPRRSAALGDGSRSRWVVGGKTNPDVFIIIAGDDKSDVDKYKQQIETDIVKLGGSLVHSQEVERLPNPSGREHFGFEDGISQPGIRGVDKDGQFIYKRSISQSDSQWNTFSLPGHCMIETGEIFLGYKNHDNVIAGPQGGVKTLDPAWALNGTFVVYRRMNQDVPKLWNFVKKQAEKLNQPVDYFASQMFGRWKSGAPIMRTQMKDIYEMGQNQYSNNAFMYKDPYVKPKLVTGEDSFEQQKESDRTNKGAICPLSAHLRKVNPRDVPTDLSGPDATLGKRLVRRGIPFGKPIDDPFTEDGVDRGLAFVSYQASIEQQFEVVIKQWVKSPGQPGNRDSGMDPIIGQSSDPNNRYFTINKTDGTQEKIQLEDPFVSVTGGGYFFMPSLSALKNVFVQ